MREPTLIIGELDDASAEGERVFYRTYNHLRANLPVDEARHRQVTPVILIEGAYMSRGFAMREEFYRYPVVREQFGGQARMLVVGPRTAAIGYYSDGKDIEAAPLRYLTRLMWTALPQHARLNHVYFPETGLYMVAHTD